MTSPSVGPAAPLTPSKYSQSEIITLLVGPEKKIFKIHKDLLTTKSEYFRGALSHDFVENDENQVLLEEDSTIVVKAFIDWSYTGRILVDSQFDYDIVNTFIFGDRICSEEFCNDLVDAFRKHLEDEDAVPHEEILETLYSQGLQQSTLAVLARKIFAYTAINHPKNYLPDGALGIEDIKTIWGDNGDLMFDVLQEILRYQAQPYKDPSKVKGCHFHRHGRGSTCSAAQNTK